MADDNFPEPPFMLGHGYHFMLVIMVTKSHQYHNEYLICHYAMFGCYVTYRDSYELSSLIDQGYDLSYPEVQHGRR